MKFRLRHIILLILTQSFTAFLVAQNVGNWTLNNTLAGTGTPLNTVGNVSAGSGIGSTSFNGGTEWYGQNGWPTGSLNTNSYIEFSLTPLSGYELNLSSVVLRLRRSNTGSPAGAGPLSWALRSSLDGFSADLATGSMTHNYANYTVSIPAFIHIAGTLTFRVYGYNATIPGGGTSRMVIDNISVQGATALLPAHFSKLTALEDGGMLRFNWRVLGLETGSAVILEGSANGRDFTEIKSWKEQAAAIVKDYQFAIQRGAQTYFRAKLIDANQLIIYTNTIFIYNRIKDQLELRAIAVSGDQLNLLINADAGRQVNYIISSSSGRVVDRGQLNLVGGQQTIGVSLPFMAHGLYFINMDGVTRSFVR